MSPEGRNAVICSGGVAIGGALARAFARKEARNFLAGCAPQSATRRLRRLAPW